jgi:hypothetical protein
MKNAQCIRRTMEVLRWMANSLQSRNLTFSIGCLNLHITRGFEGP